MAFSWITPLLSRLLRASRQRLSRVAGPNKTGFIYDAFISYSHAADDQLAPRLHDALQKFAKPWYALRALRIFRDRTTLALTPELWPEIASAIENSRFLILISSPEAAASGWVQDEVRLWLELKRKDRMLIVWTDGILEWGKTDFDWSRTNALPTVVRGVYQKEPLYLDLRWARNPGQLSMRRPEFIECVARLAAPIHGKPLDEMFGDDVNQHRLTKMVAIATSVILLAATGLATWAWIREGHARQAAERQTRIATAQQYAAESRVRAATAPQESVLLAVKALRTTLVRDEPSLAVAEEALREALLNIEGRALPRHSGAVYDVAISPNGKLLASGGADGIVRLWDCTVDDPAGTCVFLPGHTGGIRDMAFVPGGRWLIVASNEAGTRVWDLTAKNPDKASHLLEGNPAGDIVVVPSPDGRRFATGSASGTTWLWNLNDAGPSSPVELPGHSKLVAALAFDPSGTTLLTGGNDHTARLWSIAPHLPKPTSSLLTTHGSVLSDVVLSERWMVTASADTTVRLWARRGEPANPWVLRGHTDRILTIAISPDENWLLTGSEDETARLWNLLAADPTTNPIVLGGHRGGIMKAIFSPDGQWAFTASRDNTIRQWDLTHPFSNMAAKVLRGHDGPVFSLAVSPDSLWLASGSFDNSARIWKINQQVFPGRMSVFRGHTSYTEALITSDSRKIVSADIDGNVKIWDLTGENPKRNSIDLPGERGRSYSSAASENNRWVLSGNRTGTVHVYALQQPGIPRTDERKISEQSITRVASDPVSGYFAIGTERNVHVLRVDEKGSLQPKRLLTDAHEGSTCALAFSPSGRWLATSGDRDRTIAVWDLAAPEGSRAVSILEQESWIPALAFSPNGEWLAAGSGKQNGMLYRWKNDGTIGKRYILAGHSNQILVVKISRNGRWLATGSRDHSIRLWDLTAQNPSIAPRVLQAHIEDVVALAFSPDSRFLVSGSLDRTVRRWDLEDSHRIPPPLALRGAEGDITSLVVSQDGNWIVAADRRGVVFLWPLRLSDVLAAADFAAGNRPIPENP